MPKIIHRVALEENTEIRVYDCGKTLNVTVHDLDADAPLPVAFLFPAGEEARAIAKAEAMAKPRAVSVTL